MMEGAHWWILTAAGMLLVPLAYLLAAVSTATGDAKGPWKMARVAGGTVPGMVILIGFSLFLAGRAGFQPDASDGFLFWIIKPDLLSLTMQALIGFIGIILLRFSERYLAGDPGQRRFATWFLATLASIAFLVASNHLLLMSLAWISTSLCLHRLLTFYPERANALLAAHKKFLISRMADISLLSGFLILGTHYDSFLVSTLTGEAAKAGEVPMLVQVAGGLLALATLLKCAQLPFHGWLIQVMEAPTPVSALLHAGIINIGGFLMIRLSPILSEVALTQWMLVVFGTASAVLASLIMMTRISVKVNLAWSTCAQMGFMLMECGLGAYSLALLHLVAHSLYKAWAFLGSGRTVAEVVRRNTIRAKVLNRPLHWVSALALAVMAVAAMGALFGLRPAAEPALWALCLVLAVATATVIAENLALREIRPWAYLGGLCLLLSGLYMAWHLAFMKLYAGIAVVGHPPAAAIGFVMAAFLSQYGILAVIRLKPGIRPVRKLHDYLYHGLYLDEIYTYLTFKIWPPVANERRGARPV